MITKVNPNKVLEIFVNINTLYIYKLKVKLRGSKKYGNLKIIRGSIWRYYKGR